MFLPVSYYHGYIPLLIPYLYLFLGLLTYVFYATDKAAAERSSQRISEATLHILAITCGWPGAIVAQEKLRHKTIKTEFRRIFWMTVVANYLLLLSLLTNFGSSILHRLITGLEQLVMETIGQSIPGKIILALCLFQ